MMRNFLKHDPKIPFLSFHTMTTCNNLIVIYGGLISNDNINGDLIFLRLSGKTLTVVSYEKNKTIFPTPRFFHSADWDANNSKLLFFGGYSKEAPNLLDTLCVLDLKNYPQIVFQSVKNINISNRCCHGSFIHQKKLFIYGGIGVNKVLKKVQILNDFYSFDLDSGTLREVMSKGGGEMLGSLYKIINMDKNEYSFFNNDLSKFYTFNVENETFVKVNIRYNSPSNRSNYTINKLSDGRIIIFGGYEGKKTYHEIYYLNSFSFDKQVLWGWSFIDTFGAIDEGYNGHATVVLNNDNLLIHGGSNNTFDPFQGSLKNSELIVSNVGSSSFNPQITNRFKLLNIYESYRWKTKKVDNRRFEIKNRLNHISSIFPRENLKDDRLVMHGGESDGYTLCHYSIYNLNTLAFETLELPEDKFYPQIKGHASVLYVDSKHKNTHWLISGGISKEHTGNCLEKSCLNRELCNCKNEIITDSFYIFHEDDGFTQITVQNKTEFGDRLKRYAHSLVMTEDKSIYMMCGFIQYKGYVFDMIKLTIDDKGKKTLVKASEVLLTANIPGRMYASVSCVYNKIIVFGGVQENKTLNDLWMIDPITLTANCTQFDKNFILGRFGMSSSIHSDPVNENLSRLIIFGGSYFTGKRLISSMTSEVLVFHVINNLKTESIEIEAKLPIIYGFGEKKIFHSSNIYDGKIYIYGGIDTNFSVLQIPGTSNYDIIDSLNEYEKIYPKHNYADWEKSILEDELNDKDDTQSFAHSVRENESEKLLKKNK